MTIGPEVEADRGTEMNPVDAAVGKQGSLVSDDRARVELVIVWRRGDLADGDPALKESRIDIDERGPAKTGEQRRPHPIIEVEEKVRPLQDAFCLFPTEIEVRGLDAIAVVLAVGE